MVRKRVDELHSFVQDMQDAGKLIDRSPLETYVKIDGMTNQWGSEVETAFAHSVKNAMEPRQPQTLGKLTRIIGEVQK